MASRRALRIGWLLLFAAASSGQAAGPRLSLEEGRWLALEGLPPILDAEAVRAHLTSGLTTIFLFRGDRARGAGEKKVAAARVDIRYEPWEEVFFVATLRADGGARRERVESIEDLAQWWSELRLWLVDVGGGLPTAAEKVRVTLDVVPFSHAEQLETQRWFEESVHRGGRGDSNAGEEAGLTTKLFNLLIATSIQPRPVASFEWQLSPQAASGEP